MTIRPATPDDVPAVLPMVQKLCALHESWDPAKYGYVPNIVEMYRGWLTKRATDDHSVFLVADREARQPVALLVGAVEREIPIFRIERSGSFTTCGSSRTTAMRASRGR